MPPATPGRTAAVPIRTSRLIPPALLLLWSARRTPRIAKIKAVPRASPMIAAPTIADEIVDLKKQRKAILLAHHYQEPEVQELADVVGDSLELARKARE